MVSVCPQTLGLVQCVWLLLLLVSLHVVARQGNAVRLCDTDCSLGGVVNLLFSSQLPGFLYFYQGGRNSHSKSLNKLPVSALEGQYSRAISGPLLSNNTKIRDPGEFGAKWVPENLKDQAKKNGSKKTISHHSGKNIIKTGSTSTSTKKWRTGSINTETQEIPYKEVKKDVGHDVKPLASLKPSLWGKDAVKKEEYLVFSPRLRSSRRIPVSSRGRIHRRDTLSSEKFLNDSQAFTSNNTRMQNETTPELLTGDPGVIVFQPSVNNSDSQVSRNGSETSWENTDPLLVSQKEGVYRNSQQEIDISELEAGLVNSSSNSIINSSRINDTQQNSAQFSTGSDLLTTVSGDDSKFRTTVSEVSSKTDLENKFENSDEPYRTASRDVAGKAIPMGNIIRSTVRSFLQKPDVRWRPTGGHGGYIQRGTRQPPALIITAPPTMADLVVRASMNRLPITFSGDIYRHSPPRLDHVMSTTPRTFENGGYRPIEDAVDDMYRRKELFADSSEREVQDWKLPQLERPTPNPTTADSFEKPGYFVVLKEKDNVQGPQQQHQSGGSQRLHVVASTFYPHSLREIAVKFAEDDESKTNNRTSSESDGEAGDLEDQDEDDEGILPDSRLTTEKLAYVLIGTCCGLSIFCLIVVAVTMRCRKKCLQKRMKRRFQAECFYTEAMPGIATKWQANQLYSHFPYTHSGAPYIVPNASTCSSTSCPSCRCRCVTWSLGPRNLDTKPFCPTQYQRGPRKLPFGAASTLQFETTYPRREQRNKRGTCCSDGRGRCHDGDSLEDNSGSDCSFSSRHCTCVEPNHPPTPEWEAPTPLPPPPPPEEQAQDSLDSSGEVDRRWRRQDSCQHPRPQRQPQMRPPVPGCPDCPPPVTGSNYLDSANGVVFWSSNDERLI